MAIDSQKAFKTLNPNRIWIPIILGLGVVAALLAFNDDYSPEKLALIKDARIAPFIIAFIVLLMRDAGYVYRIRTLTNKNISWISSIYVIILWEFSSAVTPSVVGGAAVAVFILLKEGIKFGKSLAYVLLTAMLDNLFFLIMAPILFLLTKGDIFPAIQTGDIEFKETLQYVFFLSYGLISTYTFIMGYALFGRPRVFKWVLLKITSIRFLKKWQYKAHLHGNDIIAASKELRGNRYDYWLKIILATLFIWSARYLMLNCLIGSFAGIDIYQHFTIFSRQIVMWIIMLISPTPGSAGTAELSFAEFFKEFLGDHTMITVITWRFMTYWAYLLLGAYFLPRWIRRVYKKG